MINLFLNLARLFQCCCKISEHKAIIVATIFVNLIDIVTDLILISSLVRNYQMDQNRNTLILLICLICIWCYSCLSQAKFLYKQYKSCTICLVSILNMGSIYFVLVEYRKINEENVKQDGILTDDEIKLDKTFIKLIRFFWESEALSESLPMAFLQLPLLILVSLQNAVNNNENFVTRKFGSNIFLTIFTIISSFISLFSLSRSANLYWQFVNIDNNTEEKDEVTVIKGFQLRGCSACFVIWDILTKMLVHAAFAVLIYPYYSSEIESSGNLSLFDERGIELITYITIILCHQIWIFYVPVKKLVRTLDDQYKDKRYSKLVWYIKSSCLSLFCFCFSPSMLSFITFVHRSPFARLVYGVNFTFVMFSILAILILSGIFSLDSLDNVLLVVYIYFMVATLPYFLFGSFICLFEFKLCPCLQTYLIKDEHNKDKNNFVEKVAELVVNGPDADKKWKINSKVESKATSSSD